MINVGDKVRKHLYCADGRRLYEGVVTWVHPKQRYYIAEFVTERGGIMRDSEVITERGNYTGPELCDERWRDRKAIIIEYQGELYTLREFCRAFDMSPTTVRRRYLNGYRGEQLLVEGYLHKK